MVRSKNVLNTILIVGLVVVILSAIMIQIEIFQVKKTITDLKELFLINNDKIELSKTIDVDKYEKFLSEYILNQKNIDRLWWNTVLNQSGLSIIFTAIILFITIGISWITQNQIENKYELEITKVKEYSNNLMNDVLKISNSHSGTFGAVLTSTRALLQNAIYRINVFNGLIVLDRSQLLDIYHEDLHYLGNMIYSSVYEKINDKDDATIKKEIHEVILMIENDYDKKEVAPYIIKAIELKRDTYPENEIENKIKRDEKIIKYLNDFIFKFSQKYESK